LSCFFAPPETRGAYVLDCSGCHHWHPFLYSFPIMSMNFLSVYSFQPFEDGSPL